MKIQLLFISILVFSISAISQNKTGIGNVSTNDGIVIPNAIVQLSPVSNASEVYEYVCDKNGNYLFDITSDDSDFVLNVMPSEQTLQFTHNEVNIILPNGDNGVIYHEVELNGNNGIVFTVLDTEGEPVADAKVQIYNTKSKWRIDSCSITKPIYTDASGQVEINSLLPIKYWFNIREAYMTNRFTIDSTTTAIDAINTTNITVVIRDLTQNEFYMCGLCDNKTWITDSLIVFGITQSYDADTKLLSDATWWDSNGRFGYWWFNSSETVMTYNYLDGTGVGSIIDATNLTITDDTWVGDMEFMGMPVTYFMSVPALDDINLSVSVQDTTIYLDDNGEANITPDDLFINSTYCFTCNTTLSQSSFNIDDIGDVEVDITIEDRCGNTADNTFTVTLALNQTSVNQIVKSDVKISPNPTSDYIVIESADRKIKSIDLCAINGKSIKQFKVNSKQYTINTSELNSGIYFLIIYTNKNVITRKLIIE